MVTRRLSVVLLLLLVAAAGCSESSNSSSDAANESESTAPTTTAVDVAETGTTEEPLESGEPTTDTAEPIEGSVAPLEAYDDEEDVDSDIDDTTAWISRRSMRAESIEVVWSAPAGASEYQVHRLIRTSESKPDPAEMTAENVIHVGEENGVFLDEGVFSGEEYWYGVRGIDAEGAAISAGWHRAAAITDEQPPQPVELAIERRDDSVWLAWNEPEENYDLHGYRIRRAVGDEEPETVATTWNLDQRSFIDDEPPVGVVRYSVVSFDFHWNDSGPTEVLIDLS